MYVSHDPAVQRSFPQPEVEVTFDGFTGDKHGGMIHRSTPHVSRHPPGTEMRNERQITVLSQEEMAEVAAELGVPEVRAEWLSANLLLAGVPHLTQLPPKTRLWFPSGAVLSVEGDNLPCINAGRGIEEANRRPGLAQAFVQAAMGKRGIICTVEKPGIIRQGDEVVVEVPQQTLYRRDGNQELGNGYGEFGIGRRVIGIG